jgi:CBS-domain-containing membrane protein
MIIRDWMKQRVISIAETATVQEAAQLIIQEHIGLLPVVNAQGKLTGVIGLKDLLALELPDFYKLLNDLDFIHNFGAAEKKRPSPEQLKVPVKSIMCPATCVQDDSGLLRTYALMLKHDLHDLPIVNASTELVGIASRVDIGVAILTTWKLSEGQSA